MPDYYSLLGLPASASEADIRRAFRRLALRYHPDKTGGDARAEATFKALNEAYQTLSHPDRRARYDQLYFFGTPEPLRPVAHPRDPPRRPVYTTAPPAQPVYTRPQPVQGRLWLIWGLVLMGFVALLVLAKTPIDRYHAASEYHQAVQHLAAGDTTEALYQLSEAIFHQPDGAEAYRLRGELLRQRVGSEWLAYQDLRAALRLGPGDQDAELRLDLGLCCLKMGRLDEAERHFTQALRLEPASVRACLGRGLARYQQHNTAGACQDWQQAQSRGENAATELLQTYCR